MPTPQLSLSLSLSAKALENAPDYLETPPDQNIASPRSGPLWPMRPSKPPPGYPNHAFFRATEPAAKLREALEQSHQKLRDLLQCAEIWSAFRAEPYRCIDWSAVFSKKPCHNSPMPPLQTQQQNTPVNAVIFRQHEGNYPLTQCRAAIAALADYLSSARQFLAPHETRGLFAGMYHFPSSIKIYQFQLADVSGLCFVLPPKLYDSLCFTGIIAEMPAYRSQLVLDDRTPYIGLPPAVQEPRRALTR